LINTKQIIIASLLVIFSIGLLASPQAFADHDDDTFVNAITYLIQQGLIQV